MTTVIEANLRGEPDYWTAIAASELQRDEWVFEALQFAPRPCIVYVNAPVEADFNVNVLLAQVLWVGGSYRTGDSFVALIELQLTKKFRLGYSYDFTTTDVKNYSAGSHEIMIGYDFGYDIMKVKTPRYF